MWPFSQATTIAGSAGAPRMPAGAIPAKTPARLDEGGRAAVLSLEDGEEGVVVDERGAAVDRAAECADAHGVASRIPCPDPSAPLGAGGDGEDLAEGGDERRGDRVGERRAGADL